MSESPPETDRTRRALLGVALVAICCLVSLTGCGGKSSRGTEEPDATVRSTPEVHVVEGRVVRVAETGDYLVIRHGKIAGFMDAMTMPFPLRSAEMISGIAVNDSIHFAIEVTDGSAVITEIEKVP